LAMVATPNEVTYAHHGKMFPIPLHGLQPYEMPQPS
jgi:hypothetical protein